MGKDFSFIGLLHDNSSRWQARHSELEHEIYYLTGKDLETLRNLFAAGWTLEPPKKNDSLLAEMAALAEDDNYRPCVYDRDACEHFCRDK